MNPRVPVEFLPFALELERWLPPASVRRVLELGSRDGYVSLAFRDRFPACEVYAFECNPAAIELTGRNFAGVAGVTLVPNAVTDATGPIEFFPIDPEKTVTPHADGNIGASSLFRANPDYPSETYVQNRIVVDGVAIADWAAKAGVQSVDVVWMDLQGAELQALKGFGKLLDSVRAIYTEVEYREMYIGQPLAADVRSFLRKHGFALVAKMNSSEWFGDELFIRRSLLPWWARVKDWLWAKRDQYRG